jgi:hypothetical protein
VFPQYTLSIAETWNLTVTHFPSSH